MNASLAMKSYHQVHATGMVTDANPHRLVQMLMQGVLDALSKARGSMEHDDVAGRTRQVNRSVEMISYLRECLNLKDGGDIAANLDRLYAYMLRRLFDANAHCDRVALDEVESLMLTVKEGWDGIVDA